MTTPDKPLRVEIEAEIAAGRQETHGRDILLDDDQAKTGRERDPPG